jgi:hypothetical protein
MCEKLAGKEIRKEDERSKINGCSECPFCVRDSDVFENTNSYCIAD